MRYPAVSAIVVNYNRARMLIECVDSLVRQTVPLHEIIVVDNGSSDGSADLLRRAHGGWVKIVELDENLGFAGGNNAGAREASGEWLALINNDAVADPRWVERTLRAVSLERNAAMAACRILVSRDDGALDNVGVKLGLDGMSRGAYHFRREAEVFGPSVLLPSGCAMMIKREVFSRIGGFDEDFFAYSEDTDLGLKVRLMGYECALADDAYVYHRGGGGTLGMISPAKAYLVERNRIAILIRYYPARYVMLSPIFTAMRYWAMFRGALKVAGKAAGDGDDKTGKGFSIPAVLWSICRAYLAALGRARTDLSLRREWKRKRAVAPGTMAAWLKAYGLSRREMAALENS